MRKRLQRQSPWWRKDWVVVVGCVVAYALGSFWSYGVWAWSRTGLVVDWQVIAQGPWIATQFYDRPIVDCVLMALLFALASWQRLAWPTVAWMGSLALPAGSCVWVLIHMSRSGVVASALPDFARGWLLTTIPWGAVACGIWGLHMWRRDASSGH